MRSLLRRAIPHRPLPGSPPGNERLPRTGGPQDPVRTPLRALTGSWDGPSLAYKHAWKRFAPGTPPPQVFAQAPVPWYPEVLQASTDPTRRPPPPPPRGRRGPFFTSSMPVSAAAALAAAVVDPLEAQSPPHPPPTTGPISPSPRDRRRSRRWRPSFLEDRVPPRSGEAARSPPACPVVVVRSSCSAGRGRDNLAHAPLPPRRRPSEGSRPLATARSLRGPWPAREGRAARTDPPRTRPCSRGRPPPLPASSTPATPCPPDHPLPHRTPHRTLHPSPLRRRPRREERADP